MYRTLTSTGEKVAFQHVVSIDKRYMKYDVLTYFALMKLKEFPLQDIATFSYA